MRVVFSTNPQSNLNRTKLLLQLEKRERNILIIKLITF